MKVLELKKGQDYLDKSDSYGIYQYTGKSKKINYGYGEWQTSHQFIRRDKKIKEFGTTISWQPESSLNFYFEKVQ